MKFSDKKFMFKRIVCDSMPYEWAIPVEYAGGGQYWCVHKQKAPFLSLELLLVSVYEETTWKLYK